MKPPCMVLISKKARKKIIYDFVIHHLMTTSNSRIRSSILQEYLLSPRSMPALSKCAFILKHSAARLALLSLHPLQARSHPYTLVQNLGITPRDCRLTSHACDHHKKYQIPKCNSSFNPHFLCLGVHRTTSNTSSLENGQESR